MLRLRNGWRRSRRVIPVPAAPVWVDLDALSDIALEARDISEGGMELQLPAPLAVAIDDVLTLVLRLPSEAALRIDARVRHVDAVRIGVVFTDLPPSSRDAIYRYVSRIANRPSWWQRLRRLWQA